jgi:hypothetical protein
MHFAHNHEALKDNLTLADYNIQNQSTIFMSVRLGPYGRVTQEPQFQVGKFNLANHCARPGINDLGNNIHVLIYHIPEFRHR